MPLQRVLLGENKHIGGWGLFAGEPILKGEFIGEYAGEVSAVCEEGWDLVQVFDCTALTLSLSLSLSLFLSAWWWCSAYQRSRGKCESRSA
jgi:hypothetical protein